MLYRLIISSLLFWLPLHLYHFRGAQLAFLALISLVLAWMVLQHVAAALTQLISTQVLGEEANVFDTHLAWFSTTTRGGCGRACMMVVELAAGYSVMRVMLMARAVKQAGGSLAILGAWPVSSSAEFASSSFLRYLAATDTLLDTLLQRSCAVPLLVCAIFNVVPSFAISMLITEMPVIARAASIWWVQYRRRNKAAITKFHQYLSRYLSEHTLCFSLPTLLILHAYALAVGVGVTLTLQLYMEQRDWGPHDTSHIVVFFALVLHIVILLVSGARVCWAPVKRLLIGRRQKKKDDAAAAAAPSSSSSTHPRVVVPADKLHVN